MMTREQVVLEGWYKADTVTPQPGSLIVKRWKNGSVWAGQYSGSAKDSSFDYWCLLPDLAAPIAPSAQPADELQPWDYEKSWDDATTPDSVAAPAASDAWAWLVLDAIHLKPCFVTLDHEEVEEHRPEHVVELVPKPKAAHQPPAPSDVPMPEGQLSIGTETYYSETELRAYGDARAAQAVKASEDAKRLDWLQEQTRSSYTGISFDYAKHVEDSYVTEKGYRFMRRGYLGERKPDFRAAIDAAKEKGE